MPANLQPVANRLQARSPASTVIPLIDEQAVSALKALHMNTPTTEKTMLHYGRAAGVMYLLIIVVYMSALTLNTSFQSGTLFIPGAGS